jgi:hypothetical protein
LWYQIIEFDVANIRTFTTTLQIKLYVLQHDLVDRWNICFDILLTIVKDTLIVAVGARSIWKDSKMIVREDVF